MRCFPCFSSREEENLNPRNDRVVDMNVVHSVMPSNLTRLPSGLKSPIVMETAISSRISDSLSFLMEQEEEYQIMEDSAPLKARIYSLKHGIQFLERIFSVSSNEDLNLRIQGVVDCLFLELASLSNIPTTDGNLVLDLDRSYTILLEKMKNVIVNPETREYDVIFPKLLPDLESLLKFNEFLTTGFSNISGYADDPISPLIMDKLLFLHVLLLYVAEVGENIGVRGKEVFVTLHALLDKSACIFYSCLVGKMDREMEVAINHDLSNLLEKTKVTEIYIAVLRATRRIHLKSEFHLLSILTGLLQYSTSYVIYLKDWRMKLHDKLKSLQSFLEDLPGDVVVQKSRYLTTSTEAIISGAISTIYSFCDGNMKEEMAREVNSSLKKLFDQTDQIQIKLYNYPKSDELGFLDLFLEHLEDLLHCRLESIENLKNQIETVHFAFDSLRSFLRKIKMQRSEHEELEVLWTRIIELAYQAEYTIDHFLIKTHCGSCITKLSISDVIEQANRIVSEVEGIYDEEKYHTQGIGDAKSSNYLPLQATDAITDDAVLGFEDEAEKIMKYLLGDSKQLDVISIVGMPGLGKTTLAKKLYKETKARFDIQAWCSVSQTYQKEDLLVRILKDVFLDRDRIDKLDGEGLDEKLYKTLKGRRYLIVLDDVWDIEAWNDLVRSLPDDNTCSRILITSRLHDVASQVKVGSKVHHLRQFSDFESWELFQRKLLEKESFSQEFVKVGKKIVESCKGLPLAIIVATGLLAKLERNIKLWEQIAGNLNSHIFSDSETQCMSILELSYKELPDPLKSCFLYIGAFPEDAEIPVSKLKWLWIAEGFIRNNGEQNLDDVADGYLMDLISRSLVRATSERSCGGVKACGVHDILRDFCLEKAKKESFLVMVNNNDHDGNSVGYGQRRLCFSSSITAFRTVTWSSQSMLLNCYVRSVFTLGNVFWTAPLFISPKFRLLRVLDLLQVSTEGKYFEEVTSLIHLRYLAFKSNKISIPSTISNLSNLQHLCVSKDFFISTITIDVPDSLWDMVNLKNVKIDFHAVFDVDRGNFMHNLETLSTPYFYSEEHAEKLLRRLPKLRKLKCVFTENWGEGHGYSKAVSLTFLHQLVSLNVHFNGPPMTYGVRCRLNLPSNLQKLKLSGNGLYWDEISKIGRSLPNLKVLKISGRVEDETWIVNEGDFPTLKYLKLQYIYNIHELIASEDSFPILEQLVFVQCETLDEIPECFGGILTMRMITVRDCLPSVDDSARRIQMEQHEEWQNEQLEVLIYPLTKTNIKVSLHMTQQLMKEIDERIYEGED